MVDSYYRSVMQEVCFKFFLACELVFHILCGYGKNVKNQRQIFAAYL